MTVTADLIEQIRPAAAAEAERIYTALVAEELERLASTNGVSSHDDGALRRCNRCGETKPVDEFEKQRGTCKTCRRGQERERERRASAATGEPPEPEG